MAEQLRRLYQFGSFSLDATERILLRDSRPVQLTPKALDTLLVLVENSGHIVEKEELIRQVWPDTFVEEGNLTFNISVLRKALGEGPGGRHYIETVPRRGYRFAADVRELHEESANLIIEERTRSHITIDEEQEAGQSTVVSTARLSSQEEVTFNLFDRPVLARFQSAGSEHVPQASRLRRILLISLLPLLIVGGLVVIFHQTIIQEQFNSSASPFQLLKLVRLTNTGKSIEAAISPDGKLVAHVVEDAGRQSLWIRQVAVPSDTQIVPPALARYLALSFSPDGNWVYYVRDHTLYRVPALGGAPRQVIANVDRSITLSPTGELLAFVREEASRGESAIFIVRSDGMSERRLAARTLPEYFGTPAWSPDGRVIACSVGTRSGDRYMSIAEVDVGEGSERAITPHKWFRVASVGWLSDGDGLMINAAEQREVPNQFWHVSHQSGEVRKVTNDLNDYRGLSLAADSKSLVTIESNRLANIWLQRNSDQNQTTQITTGAGQNDRPCWTTDGRIVYESLASGNREIWIMQPEASAQRQLTIDAGVNFSPAVSSDGRYIVFASTRSGAQCIWRMSIDGSNPKQLTNGSGDNFPRCSPDGKWVFYTSDISGRASLWKVSIDGGESVPVTDKLSRFPDISPDGKFVACYYWNENPDSPAQIAVIPLAGGEPLKVLDLPWTVGSWRRAIIRWSPDGRALAYIDNRDGISNIWSLPLRGGTPKQLTSFNSDQILSFDWSRDGSLACSRAIATNDVILIADGR